MRRSAAASSRLITTQLNVEGDNIQLHQTRELLDKPASTDLRVVMIGDYNSATAGAEFGEIGSFPPDAYHERLDAGFTDAWALLRPDEDAFTHGQAAFLDNEKSTAITRIDLIMVRNGARRGRVCSSSTRCRS